MADGMTKSEMVAVFVLRFKYCHRRDCAGLVWQQ